MIKPTVGIPYYNDRGGLIGYECAQCFSKGEFSMFWDSYYCANCVQWLDNGCKCASGSCPFADRPEVPDIKDEDYGY